MAAPALAARVEKHQDTTRDQVSTAQVAGFGQIAFQARPGQVARIIVTVMLLGDNVLDVRTQERIIGFMQSTVFTAFAGPQAHERADGLFHAGWPFRARRMRALALRMATT